MISQLTQAQLFAIITNSREAIALLDEKFQPIYRTPSAQAITGWTEEERATYEGIDKTHPDDIDTLKNTMQEVLKNPGKQVVVVFRTQHKAGHYVWVRTIMTNLLREESVNAIVVNFEDITLGKQTEETLQKNIREISDYKYALDQSSIVAITNQKGIINYVNDNFCKISKYRREELIGQDHRIINSGHHPKEFIRNIWTTIAKGNVWKGELKNKAKDGTIYWVDTTIIPFLNEEGKPYQYIAIRSDITERKKVEEAISLYKDALDESAIVAITNQKGIIKHVNDNFCKISKYGREELIGQDHRIINSGYHTKEFIKNLWTTIANGNVWKGELKNKAKDGTIYWVDTTIVPFLDEKGKPYQYLAIRSDITERKRSEEKLKNYSTELEKQVKDRTLILEEAIEELEKTKKELNHALDKEKELNELKSRFVSMASHEFRTPLTTMMSSLSLVTKYTEQNDKENQSKHVGKIKTSINTLTDILNDFLSVSRLEEGKIQNMPEEMDLKAFITEVMGEMSSMADKQKLTQNHSGKEIASFDKKILKNILFNLISNAIKFSPNGGTIQVNTEVSNSAIKLLVKDEGIGISKEDQKHLFERFFRGHNATHIQGTGLGLNIVGKYVELMNATIHMESEEKKGTLFTIIIPQ